MDQNSCRTANTGCQGIRCFRGKLWCASSSLWQLGGSAQKNVKQQVLKNIFISKSGAKSKKYKLFKISQKCMEYLSYTIEVLFTMTVPELTILPYCTKDIVCPALLNVHCSCDPLVQLYKNSLNFFFTIPLKFFLSSVFLVCCHSAFTVLYWVLAFLPVFFSSKNTFILPALPMRNIIQPLTRHPLPLRKETPEKGAHEGDPLPGRSSGRRLPPPPVDRMNDTRLWKQYLPPYFVCDR